MFRCVIGESMKMELYQRQYLFTWKLRVQLAKTPACEWSAQCNYNCYEAMHKLHYTSMGPLERGPADGMGPLIRLGIKLLFIYSVDKMLPRLIVVGEGNIADCCHWWWLLCRPLYSAGDEYHYTLPSWCPGPWNNGKEVPRWGVAEIQKMSTSTTGRCYCCH